MTNAAQPVDVIILSYAANDALRIMTETAVTSLMSSEDPARVKFNVVIIESNASLEPFQYPHSRTLYPQASFGYNRFLNIGVRETQSDFVCLANNDLQFHRGWASAILAAADARRDVMSFSPMDPWLHEKLGFTELPEMILGYEKMKHFTGWCFVVRREIFEVISEFDERLEFWYVDDDYIETLRKHGLLHALVRDSKVDHLSGHTVSELSEEKKAALTSAQWLYYDYKWNHRSPILYALKKIRFRLGRALNRTRLQARS